MRPPGTDRLVRFLVLGLVVAAAGCTGSGDKPSSESPSASGGPVVEAGGIGPLRVGMSVAQAEASIRTAMESSVAVTDTMQCRYASWAGAPAGVSVMIEGNRIVRIDVDSAGIPTAEGARVGDRASRIESLYGSRLTRTPHKYVPGGEYLAIPADSGRQVVFETEKGVVTRYRAGQRPQVEYVERCG